MILSAMVLKRAPNSGGIRATTFSMVEASENAMSPLLRKRNIEYSPSRSIISSKKFTASSASPGSM
jgi:hypothetical protein